MAFIVLWLSFAFLINKAPNYTRLLITLPFVAYFVAVTTRFLAGRVQLLAADWRPQWAARARMGFVGVTITALAALNLAIAWDFIQEGRKNGEPIGSTGRYIESHRDVPGKKFYLAADDGSYMYYTFGNSFSDRLRLFAHDGQVGQNILPAKPERVQSVAALRDLHDASPLDRGRTGSDGELSERAVTRRHARRQPRRPGSTRG